MIGVREAGLYGGGFCQEGLEELEIFKPRTDPDRGAVALPCRLGRKVQISIISVNHASTLWVVQGVVFLCRYRVQVSNRLFPATAKVLPSVRFPAPTEELIAARIAFITAAICCGPFPGIGPGWIV